MAMSHSVYFVGIGGIGMSAIARHFHVLGALVAGYDRTPSDITRALEAEGIGVSYADNPETVPPSFRDPSSTLVVFTPAVPSDSRILCFFREGGFRVVKRAVALGELTRPFKTLCVAGTHGKTTTSTLAAHILRQSAVGCSAFLGGVSVNYQTNYWGDAASGFVVTEADEYDRSFLQLEPTVAVITAMDADHLDIYGTHAEVIKAFLEFAARVRPGGRLFVRYGLPIGREDVAPGVGVFTYSSHDVRADFHAEAVRVEEGRYVFDVVTPRETVAGVRLGIPGVHNVENCVAAVAMALAAGVPSLALAGACGSFRGNRRRFEVCVESDAAVVIDDYAHHPQEIETTIRSVRALYPGRRLTVAFQPHLYSRTRDLADDFANALNMADRVWLIDIYPAREKPIDGVTSEMLIGKMRGGLGRMSSRDGLADNIVSEEFDIVLVMGAGDIADLVPAVADRVRGCMEA